MFVKYPKYSYVWFIDFYTIPWKRFTQHHMTMLFWILSECLFLCCHFFDSWYAVCCFQVIFSFAEGPWRCFALDAPQQQPQLPLGSRRMDFWILLSWNSIEFLLHSPTEAAVIACDLTLLKKCRFAPVLGTMVDLENRVYRDFAGRVARLRQVNGSNFDATYVLLLDFLELWILGYSFDFARFILRPANSSFHEPWLPFQIIRFSTSFHNPVFCQFSLPGGLKTKTGKKLPCSWAGQLN